MTEIEICEAREEQLDILRDLSIKTFGEAFGRYNSQENMQAYIQQAFSIQSFKHQWAKPITKFYLGWLGSEPVGYLKINEVSAENFMSEKKGIEIERIYVLEKCYGKGVGQKLLEWSFQVAREQRASYVWLGVWENNARAIRFYEKNGFKTFGKHPFILGQDTQTDWLMYRWL